MPRTKVTKTIGGKRWSSDIGAITKTRAKAIKEKYKDQGKNARIVPMGKGRDQYYLVFTR